MHVLVKKIVIFCLLSFPVFSMENQGLCKTSPTKRKHSSASERNELCFSLAQEVEVRKLVIDILKEGNQREEIAKKYNISKKLLIKKIKKHNDRRYSCTLDLPKIPPDPAKFHDPKFIFHVVNLCISNEKKKSEIQKEYSLGHTTVNRWLKNYKDGKYDEEFSKFKEMDVDEEYIQKRKIHCNHKRKSSYSSSSDDLTEDQVRDMLTAVLNKKETGKNCFEVAKEFRIPVRKLQKKIEEHNDGIDVTCKDLQKIPTYSFKSYPTSFIIDILKEYFFEDKPKFHIQRDHGLGHSTLNRWIKNFENGKYDFEILGELELLTRRFSAPTTLDEDAKKNNKVLSHNEVRNMLLAVLDKEGTQESKFQIANRFQISVPTLLNWIRLHSKGKIKETIDLPKIECSFKDIYHHKDIVDILSVYFSKKKSKLEMKRLYHISSETLAKWIKNFQDGKYDEHVFKLLGAV